MSTLEDGWPATIREGDEGFCSEGEARAYYDGLDDGFPYGEGYSEYGLIEEDYPLNTLVTVEQADGWASERIRTLSWYRNGMQE